MKMVNICLMVLWFMQSCPQSNHDGMIIYMDQNNNRYEISGNQLKYISVRSQNSSSGTYSGGEDREIGINEDDFNHLKQLSFKLIEATETHAPKREMMTAVLIVSGHNVILRNSPERQRLESSLLELRK